MSSWLTAPTERAERPRIGHAETCAPELANAQDGQAADDRDPEFEPGAIELDVIADQPEPPDQSRDKEPASQRDRIPHKERRKVAFEQRPTSPVLAQSDAMDNAGIGGASQADPSRSCSTGATASRDAGVDGHSMSSMRVTPISANARSVAAISSLP